MAKIYLATPSPTSLANAPLKQIASPPQNNLQSHPTQHYCHPTPTIFCHATPLAKILPPHPRNFFSTKPPTYFAMSPHRHVFITLRYIVSLASQPPKIFCPASPRPQSPPQQYNLMSRLFRFTYRMKSALRVRWCGFHLSMVHKKWVLQSPWSSTLDTIHTSRHLQRSFVGRLDTPKLAM